MSDANKLATASDLNEQLCSILDLLTGIRERLDSTEERQESPEVGRGFKTPFSKSRAQIKAPGIYSHLISPLLSEKQRAEVERAIASRERELSGRYQNLSKDLLQGKFDITIRTANSEVFNLRGDAHKQ